MTSSLTLCHWRRNRSHRDLPITADGKKTENGPQKGGRQGTGEPG
jgi:hypothetical protein